jgi:hypothetical protein
MLMFSSHITMLAINKYEWQKVAYYTILSGENNFERNDKF